MFSTIKIKIYAAIVAVFGFLVLMLGRKNDKIDELRIENAKSKKVEKIANAMEKARKQADEQADKERKEIVNDQENWRDQI